MAETVGCDCQLGGVTNPDVNFRVNAPARSAVSARPIADAPQKSTNDCSAEQASRRCCDFALPAIDADLRPRRKADPGGSRSRSREEFTCGKEMRRAPRFLT